MTFIKRQCSAEPETGFGLTQGELRTATRFTEPGAAFAMAA